MYTVYTQLEALLKTARLFRTNAKLRGLWFVAVLYRGACRVLVSVKCGCPGGRVDANRRIVLKTGSDSVRCCVVVCGFKVEA
jgi:hypothetical protein